MPLAPRATIPISKELRAEIWGAGLWQRDTSRKYSFVSSISRLTSMCKEYESFDSSLRLLSVVGLREVVLEGEIENSGRFPNCKGMKTLEASFMLSRGFIISLKKVER